METYKGFLLMVSLLFTSCMEPSEQMDTGRYHQYSIGDTRRQIIRSSDLPPTRRQNSRNLYGRIPANVSLNAEEEHTLLENYQRSQPNIAFAMERFPVFNLENGVLPHEDQRLVFNLAERLHRKREQQGLPDINWAQGHVNQVIQFYLLNPSLFRNPTKYHRHWLRAFPNLPFLDITQFYHEINRLSARQDIIRARRIIESHQQTSQPEVHPVGNVTANSPHSETRSNVGGDNVHISSADQQASTSRESGEFDA